MSKKLKSGLEFFIKKVEAMPDNTEFNMSLYQECVIGKSLNGVMWDEKEILRKKFGIERKRPGRYFSPNKAMADFLPHQKDVLILFTSAVGIHQHKISKSSWLLLARAQLAVM